jgi:hypothetical protein
MAKQEARRSAPKPVVSDKLYMENTLLRVAGALFCHDAKRASTHTDEIELNRGVPDKKILIRPDPRLGQPGPLAHKIFVALIKKHSNYGRPIQSDVSFSKRELMRLIGRKQWGGRDSDQLTRALEEIHHAFVRTHFKTQNGRFAEHSFNIFPEVYLERAESETDPVETCTVTLARPIVQSLNDEHFTCLNHTLMQELGTIGQALYMRLFFHFANLYQDHPRHRPTFSKRYDDICAEWLGGLTVHKHRSTLERDQLGPHLRQLRQADFLASYAITEAARGDGFIMTFRPGSAFVRDYDRFYRGRHQPAMRFEFNRDREEVAEPLKVAYLFQEKRSGKTAMGIPYVSSKEVQTAKELLKKLSFEEMPQFLTYALQEAEKTKFDVQHLGGLRQYVSSYIEKRASTARQAAQSTHNREVASQAAYTEFRRRAALALFNKLPEAERHVIEQAARKGRGKAAGPMAAAIFESVKADIIAQRHSQKIPSYADWNRSATFHH